MHRVLIVSFLFPPANNIGALRMGRFAKCLPEFGWEPIVLTVNKVDRFPQTLPVEIADEYVLRTKYFKLGLPRRRRQSGVSDREIDIRIDSRRRVSGAFASSAQRILRSFYSLPLTQTFLSNQTGWYLPGVKKGLQIVKEYNIDVVFSTYDPAAPHMIASRLSKKTGVPWVADFRDPWATSLNLRKRIQPMQFLEELFEKRVIRRSSLLTTVSELWAEELKVFHGKRVAVIPNGFDEDDYRGESPLPTSKFTITYVGNVYDYDMAPLFQAVKELRDEGAVTAEDFGIRFFGYDVGRRLPSIIEKHQLGDLAFVYGSVPFEESIRRQRESTILLLLGRCDSRDKGVVPAKLFEYLGSGRPILAVTAEGDVVDSLLRESGAGVIANQQGAIKALLLKWLGEFRECGGIISNYAPNATAIQNYTRREQTRKLAEVFEEVLKLSPKRGG